MISKFLGFIKNLMLKYRFTTVIGIFFKWFIRVGPKGAIAHVKHFTAFDKYKIDTEVSKEVRKAQENRIFKKNVKFSVLVPLYNTPEKFLREMIDSVVSQTYKNFELCLADGSDNEHNFVGEICKEYAKYDDRIIYKKLDENKGIAENTNECIAMSSGDYIALFDHDDLLHPSALYEVAEVVEREDADFIYTDELTFDGNKGPKSVIARHYKPDYSYYNLLANNYICHFSVFKASLIDEVGGFRTKYDGSQDHDMILRLTTAAKKVYHIPKLLYFWRSHKNSVAMDIGSKMYAVKSGINLVIDHLKEKGIKADVESSPAFPTIYRVTYELKEKPLASVIVLCNTISIAELTVKKIFSNTEYKNYELILVLPQNLSKEYKPNEKVKVVFFDETLNTSSVYNKATLSANGEYLVFLNEGCFPENSAWLNELLCYAQLDEVGAVGAKVLYKNGTVKSIGKIVGFGETVAEDRYEGTDKSELGYFGKLFYSQNVSAVASDCFVVKKVDFEGFDSEYKDSLYDTDLCLKLINKGKINITNPFSVMVSFEKAKKINTQDEKLFRSNWDKLLEEGDPYYNKSLPEGYYYF